MTIIVSRLLTWIYKGLENRLFVNNTTEDCPNSKQNDVFYQSSMIKEKARRLNIKFKMLSKWSPTSCPKLALPHIISTSFAISSRILLSYSPIHPNNRKNSQNSTPLHMVTPSYAPISSELHLHQWKTSFTQNPIYSKFIRHTSPQGHKEISP